MRVNGVFFDTQKMQLFLKRKHELVASIQGDVGLVAGVFVQNGSGKTSPLPASSALKMKGEVGIR
ncbi:hypothetical protein ACFQ4C_27590 [Larkinella insperata]|uniref:Uncharacterized protein n=1 Tax=Larkinella insperata TaxID=332158 RepID=A0ABW3QDH7_9BACT|nr:hypothetical protein [Larkinella insperata]